MSPWLLLLAGGLGTMKIVDFVKEITPWPFQPWTKSAMSFAAASGLVAPFVHDGSHFAVLMFGLAGVAALAHELTDAFWMTSDFLKQQVILRGTARRR